MNFIARKAKVFAVLPLIFANSLSAPAQGSSIYRLAAGTMIKLVMDAGISSKFSTVNDRFTAAVAKPIIVDGAVVLPLGALVEGRVTGVTGASHGGKHGQLQLRFETIRFSGSRKRIIDGVLSEELRPRSALARNLFSIVGGTVAGAVIGAAAGIDRGLLAGAGIGAGAGTALVLMRKGKEVSIETDEEFEIELKREVMLPARDY